MKVLGFIGDWFTINNHGTGVDKTTPAWILVLDIIFVGKAPLFVDKFAPLWITRRTIERRRRVPIRRPWAVRAVIHNSRISYRREIHSDRAGTGAFRRSIPLALHNPPLYGYRFYESQYFTW